MGTYQYRVERGGVGPGGTLVWWNGLAEWGVLSRSLVMILTGCGRNLVSYESRSQRGRGAQPPGRRVPPAVGGAPNSLSGGLWGVWWACARCARGPGCSWTPWTRGLGSRHGGGGAVLGPTPAGLGLPGVPPCGQSWIARAGVAAGIGFLQVHTCNFLVCLEKLHMHIDKS